MAGFDFSDNEYSLAGLTQESWNVNVTVISDSDDGVDNYASLLECVKLLGKGENMDSSNISDHHVKPNVEPDDKHTVKLSSIKSQENEVEAPKLVTSSMAGQAKLFDVSSYVVSKWLKMHAKMHVIGSHLITHAISRNGQNGWWDVNGQQNIL